jgi:CRP/FNR family transcriptional regulator, cyclic AMP receptor protein
MNNPMEALARAYSCGAHLDKNGPAFVEIPILSRRVLAEMVGTTRPRVNMFMNRFRKKGKLGFITYNGEIQINDSLLSAVLHD